MATPVSDARQRTIALCIALAAIAIDGAAAPSAAGAVAAAEGAWHADGALRDAAALAFDLPYELAVLASLWLLDNHGKRDYFRGSLLGYGSACVLAALAPSPAIFVTARVLQGAALGSVFASALFTLVGISEPKRLPTVFAWFTLVALAAPTLGPLAAAAASHLAGWRATFALLAFAPLVAGAAAAAILRDAEPPRARLFDTASFVALALALLSFHAAIAGFSSGDPQTYVFGAAGAIALVWFVAREAFAREPFVDAAPLGMPFMRAALLACALVGLLLGVTATIVPFARVAFGDVGTGTELAASRFIGEAPGALVVLLLWRRAIDNRILTLVGIVAFAATFALQAVAAAESASVGLHVALAAAQGFALALVLGPLASLVFDAAPRSQFKALALLFKIALVLGGALAPSLETLVAGPALAVSAYPLLWFSAAALGVVAGIVLAVAPAVAKPLGDAAA